MAKITHNSFLDVIDTVFSDAKSRRTMHLVANEGQLCGRYVKIENNILRNFGTCGYLGLEMDERLKKGAMIFAEKYGVQYSISRTYAQAETNSYLESLLSQIYDGHPVIVFPSTSTAHISIIPTLIDQDDAVILDQQVHMSIQTATQLLRQKGTVIEMIKHNDLNMLERKIQELGNRYKKIWYMIDGVYSMYGDLAPLHELTELMHKYRQLHVYADDAHGMSWCGENGAGYVFSQVRVPANMILITTLAKGFGTIGGIAVFPDQETQRKVKIFGGPLSYSHPLAPPMLGASIASARIHLSDEISTMQAELREKMQYCNELLAQKRLPVISNPDTPIYFIGMGLLKVGNNMVKKLMEQGFFVNLALFPVVPMRNTGLRFTLTRHQEKEDIAALVSAIEENFSLALKEEGESENEIRRTFKLPLIEKASAYNDRPTTMASSLTLQCETSIKAIDKGLWDTLFAMEGSFDWEGLDFLEQVFQGNLKPEENWQFFYYIVRDSNNTPILATFFTFGIYKDDFISLPSISEKIEEMRKTDPYYLTSRTLAMGTLLTEGNHLYLNRTHPQWKDALRSLLKEISDESERLQAETLMLRDLDEDAHDLQDIFLEHSYVQMRLPNTNIIENMQWQTVDEFLDGLNTRNRSHIRKDTLAYLDYFDIEVKDQLSDEEADYLYHLFLNIKRKNFAINFFDYPSHIMRMMSAHKNWEFILLKLKPEYDPRETRHPVAAMCCYKGRAHYCPLLAGLDYDYLLTHKVYKQIMFQVLVRARQLGLSKIYFGLSADTEKRKLSAKQYPKIAYIQTKDNYNMEVIAAMAASENV